MPTQSGQDLSNFQTLVSVATERPRVTIQQQKNILNQNNPNVKFLFPFRIHINFLSNRIMFKLILIII